MEAMKLPGVIVIVGDFTSTASWRDHLHGQDVVINAAGIIRETSVAHCDEVHTRAPIAMFEAAERAQVKRVIQISALGAEPMSHLQANVRSAVGRTGCFVCDPAALSCLWSRGSFDDILSISSCHTDRTNRRGWPLPNTADPCR